MKRLFLIGFMGAGKSTLGKAFAEYAGLSFIDLDIFIENRFHKTISEIFAEKGETTFRNIERNALLEVSDFENIIIATGGGAPCFGDNINLMNERGTTIYLKVSVDELTARVGLHKHTRPLLKNLSGDELKQYITSTLSKREKWYNQAKITMEAEQMNTPSDVTVLCHQLEKLLSNC